MSKFKNTLIDIGQVKERSSVLVEYELLDKDTKIKDVLTGCAGCTKYVGKDEEKLVFEFYSPSFPLDKFGQIVPIYKDIDVFFEDGTSEKLKFVGDLIQ